MMFVGRTSQVRIGEFAGINQDELRNRMYNGGAVLNPENTKSANCQASKRGFGTSGYLSSSVLTSISADGTEGDILEEWERSELGENRIKLNADAALLAFIQSVDAKSNSVQQRLRRIFPALPK